ncbi:MAG: nitroreductase family protein [Lachnospiraceae bacterium]|nr:nitroreductase family protein [Lachnospiraceae bacterium]
MDLLEIMQTRRSVRSYTGAPIAEEDLTKILQAGLLSASGHAARPWELIVVRDKAVLAKMAECRVGAAKMLAGADTAIVVVADEEQTDVWVEDSSIVMANMHLMADSLGVGSCWIQGRLRNAPDGRTTEEYLRELLAFPERYRLEAVLSLGMPERHPAKTELSELLTAKIHREKF